MAMNLSPIRTSIAPWLSVRQGTKAVEFYQVAFGAVETYRLEEEDGGVVAKLSVDGADFWRSDESPGKANPGGPLLAAEPCA